jgi:hypothetical protein
MGFGMWTILGGGTRRCSRRLNSGKKKLSPRAIENAGLLVYANNAAAWAAGLQAGQMYRMASGDLKIVY